MMTVKQCRTMLSACHVEAGEIFDLYKDCGEQYLIDRAREEFSKLSKYPDSILGNPQKMDSAALIIQLMTMLRCKVQDKQINGQVRPEGQSA